MKTVEWSAGTLTLIDQTALPDELRLVNCSEVADVAKAIKAMVVRGAPAIGVAAAYGVALAAQNSRATEVHVLLAELETAGRELKATRPTAVNLSWAVDRVLRAVAVEAEVTEIAARALSEADAIAANDEAMCRAIGRHGAILIAEGANVLTHCNAGGLATVTYGTALGVIRAAQEQGRHPHVFVDETRPVLQGARLTAWELSQEGIDFTLITDNMAGHFMARGRVDLVVVGADRIAANGDVANKIGTYSVAVLAKEHGIPFYVAAPTSTIDPAISDGEQIPIEERDPDEVVSVLGRRIAPPGARVANPAFDVTPNRYVTAIITEDGVLRPPFRFDSSLLARPTYGGRSS